VKAIMGLASGGLPAISGTNVQAVTVPALLVAGTLDASAPPTFSQGAFDMLASTEKDLILIENAKHRHFQSGFCAQTQNSGAVAAASTRAILDLQRIQTLVTGPSVGVAMDFCRFDTFTNPSDIRPLVAQLTGFNVTPDNVPTTGLDSDEVKEEVIELAVKFFRDALERDR
jgi:predicted dienelactone hydrolase